MTRLEFIPSQCIKINQDQRDDLAQWVICGIHIAPNSSAGVARAWKVNADNTDAGEIVIPSEGGKDDTVACKVLSDGGVRFVVSEAEAPGASGSTARPFAYVVPNVFPPRTDYRPAVDQPARNQANSCTNMIHANNASLEALEVRVNANEAAIAALGG